MQEGVRSYRLDNPEIIADPYSVFASMRRESPVCKLEPAGFWAVSRYEDVLFVFRNHRLFSNSGYTAANPTRVETRDESMSAASIVESDPPKHTQLRSLVTRAFTPRVVAGLEPRIREICNELVDTLAQKDSFDLVQDFTIPLPMIVIAELLGVEPERRMQFKHWCDDLLNSLSLTAAANRERVERAGKELAAYFMGIIEQRKVEPRDDLITHLLNAEVDGVKLTLPEVVGFANTLLIAGNETTTSLVGNSLIALTDHPDQYARMAADPSLIPQVVEEVLRYHSPAQLLFRKTTEDVPLAGVTIPKGAVVTPLIASANRDERKFPDGDRFDITREAKGHIAFGFDIHFCAGAALARLEAKVALEVLTERLGMLRRRSPQPDWAPSLFVRAPSTLWLERAPA